MKIVTASLLLLVSVGIQEEAGISKKELQDRRAELLKRCGGKGAVIVEAGRFRGAENAVQIVDRLPVGRGGPFLLVQVPDVRNVTVDAVEAAFQVPE